MKRSIVASSEPTSMSGIQIKLRLRTDVEKTREPSTKNRRLKRRGSSRETCSTCILSKKTNNTSCDCIVIMKRVHGIYIISYEDIHCQIPVHRWTPSMYMTRRNISRILATFKGLNLRSSPSPLTFGQPTFALRRYFVIQCVQEDIWMIMLLNLYYLHSNHSFALFIVFVILVLASYAYWQGEKILLL
jgi:hypothetical protein